MLMPLIMRLLMQSLMYHQRILQQIYLLRLSLPHHHPLMPSLRIRLIDLLKPHSPGIYLCGFTCLERFFYRILCKRLKILKLLSVMLQMIISRVRNESSTSSCDSGDTEQLAADLVLPPTGTQPGAASGSKRTEVYYFYQAADGQRLYLHSINTR